MANEVRIGLGVTGADKAAHDLKKVGNAADGTGDDLKDMAGDAKVLDKAIDGLNAKLLETRRRLAADPGDKTLWKELRSGEREVNKLTKLRKAVFGDDSDLKGVGLAVGKTVGSGIGDALSALPAQLKGAGIAIGGALVAGAAPFLGAAIAAAVLGGVGLGGIAGGIAAAAQDPRVKAAGEHLGESLTASLAGVGAPFVEPLLQQMGRLEGIGGSFLAKLGEDIAPLADHLDELTDGIAGFARNLDFSKAVEAAGPIIDVIGKKLPDAADALTNMLDSIADGGDGAAHGLGEVFDALEGGIEVTGRLVGELAKIEPYVTTGGSALLDLTDALNEQDIPLGLIGWIDKIAQTEDAAIRARGSADELGEGLSGVGQAARATSKEVEGLSDAMDQLFGKQMSLDEATIRYKQGLHDLREELTDGTRTLSENTEEGRENRGAVLDQIQAIEDLREAQFAQTGNLREANATYDKHIAQLRTTLANLGYNKAEIEKLIGAYQRLTRELAALLGSFAAGRNAAEGSEPVSGRASGGPVEANRPYVVGEDGPELVTFGAAGYVHNASQTKAMMSGTQGGFGAMTEAQMTRILANAVASGVATAMNSVSIQMDRHTVGRLQASEADIYARSGA